MRKIKRIAAALAVILIMSSVTGCSRKEENVPVPEEVEKNGEIYILFTSDVHCGIDQGFGYAGLQQVRDSLEQQGYETILVDNGDAIQGEVIGMLTKGEKIIELMNDAGYDLAIPGNHEFDYGMENFLGLTEKADFPYISCNFNYKGELVFEPYKIIEKAGLKIAFIGITTPTTLTSSTPRFFMDDSGEFVYGFLQDTTGEKVYSAVQEAVDDARREGADLVYAMGHLGMYSSEMPWTYAEVISNTSGIDVFLDGHSHDTEQVVMKNKDGDDVVRSACGTKMSCIGYSRIAADGTVAETGIWSWPNKKSVSQLLGVSNQMSEKVEIAAEEASETVRKTVAKSNVELTINDPFLKDQSGNPIRMVRRAETNMGDLCADAYRAIAQADIGFVNGGGVRAGISKGDITYADIITINPFGNSVCVIRAKGQQILDALEWGARALPGENGGFLQVSGLSYSIDVNTPSSCGSDENGMFTGVSGERRVRDVKVGDEPIDPDGYYLVAGIGYILLNNGDGQTAFEGAEVVSEHIGVDYEILITYITEKLGGEVGTEYADPYGDGRITIIQ